MKGHCCQRPWLDSETDDSCLAANSSSTKTAICFQDELVISLLNCYWGTSFHVVIFDFLGTRTKCLNNVPPLAILRILWHYHLMFPSTNDWLYRLAPFWRTTLMPVASALCGTDTALARIGGRSPAWLHFLGQQLSLGSSSLSPKRTHLWQPRSSSQTKSLVWILVLFEWGWKANPKNASLEGRTRQPAAPWRCCIVIS